jgi:hypothetical protein
MRRKLLVLTTACGIAVMAAWAPRAEALATCDVVCDGPSTMSCTCPQASDRPGRGSTCNLWQGTGTRGCFLL